jgi:hypothetical protein
MKHAILALALLTAPLTACSSFPTIPASASKIDEQALGSVYAAATLANYAIKASAPTMSKDQALKVKAFKVKVDSAVKAAERAKEIGDAFAYSQAVADATSALNSITANLPKVN